MPTLTQERKEQKLDQFKHICKEQKIKLTPQRLLIYEELLNTKEHPSTDMLYQRVIKTFPTISFDTVNRTLLTFNEIGLASVVEGTGNPKRFDGNISKHHHVQCLRCKRLIDVYDPAYDAIRIPPDIQEQFHALKVTVHIEGICQQCQHKDSYKKI